MDRIKNHPILGETPEKKKVTFSYDGRILEGYEGEPISVALKAAGVVTGVSFLILAIYSAIWIKKKMKLKVFKSVPLEKVMAMENALYYEVRKRRGIWK